LGHRSDRFRRRTAVPPDFSSGPRHEDEARKSTAQTTPLGGAPPAGDHLVGARTRKRCSPAFSASALPDLRRSGGAMVLALPFHSAGGHRTARARHPGRPLLRRTIPRAPPATGARPLGVLAALIASCPGGACGHPPVGLNRVLPCCAWPRHLGTRRKAGPCPAPDGNATVQRRDSRAWTGRLGPQEITAGGVPGRNPAELLKPGYRVSAVTDRRVLQGGGALRIPPGAGTFTPARLGQFPHTRRRDHGPPAGSISSSLDVRARTLFWQRPFVLPV